MNRKLRFKVLLSIFLFICITSCSSVKADCSFEIGVETGSPQPIFVNPGTESLFQPSFRDRKSFIKLKSGDKIELWCSGPWDTSYQINTNSINLFCDKNQLKFKVNNFDYSVNLKDFKCKNIPETTTRLRSEKTAKCYDDGSFIDVGYEIDNNRFLTLYEVCHNANQKANRYVKHFIWNRVDVRQKGIDRASTWTEPPQYDNMKVSSLYSIYVQRQNINRILNLDGESDKFVDRNAKAANRIKADPDNEDKYLARGHLAPLADFFFASWQDASLNYLNAAPQWQSFNGFNWVDVENWARNKAKSYPDGLEVYTGTHGVLTLPNSKNVQLEIFLRHYPNKPKQIPVPKYYYKILLNRNSRDGVVFIGINNPFINKNEISNYNLCDGEDITILLDLDKSPLDKKRKTLNRGYVYACQLNSFLKNVNLKPYLNLGIYEYNLMGKKAAHGGQG